MEQPLPVERVQDPSEKKMVTPVKEEEKGKEEESEIKKKNLNQMLNEVANQPKEI